MDRFSKENLRRLRRSLSLYSPEFLEQDNDLLLDAVANFASGGTSWEKIPEVGRKRMRELYDQIWSGEITLEQFKEGDF